MSVSESNGVPLRESPGDDGADFDFKENPTATLTNPIDQRTMMMTLDDPGDPAVQSLDDDRRQRQPANNSNSGELASAREKSSSWLDEHGVDGDWKPQRMAWLPKSIIHPPVEPMEESVACETPREDHHQGGAAGDGCNVQRVTTTEDVAMDQECLDVGLATHQANVENVAISSDEVTVTPDDQRDVPQHPTDVPEPSGLVEEGSHDNSSVVVSAEDLEEGASDSSCPRTRGKAMLCKHGGVLDQSQDRAETMKRVNVDALPHSGNETQKSGGVIEPLARPAVSRPKRTKSSGQALSRHMAPDKVQ